MENMKELLNKKVLDMYNLDELFDKIRESEKALGVKLNKKEYNNLIKKIKNMEYAELVKRGIEYIKKGDENDIR